MFHVCFGNCQNKTRVTTCADINGRFRVNQQKHSRCNGQDKGQYWSSRTMPMYLYDLILDLTDTPTHWYLVFTDNFK